MQRRTWLPLLLAVAVTTPAWAAPTDAPPGSRTCTVFPEAQAFERGDLDALEPYAARELSSSHRVASVVVHRRQIFDLDDPAEDNPLYRLANRLHVLTRESTVREQLTFLQGDAYDAPALRQAERILRQFRWIYDARVVPLRACGDDVEVGVLSRDVWSVVPTGDINRSGGETSYAFGVKDINLFGRGETLGAFYQDGVDRQGSAMFYRDPSLAGTNWRLALAGADNNDGGNASLDLREPYRSLDDRESMGITASWDERVQPLFDRGFRNAEFAQRSRDLDLFISRAGPRKSGWIRRWRAGLAHWDREFEVEPGVVQPLAFPEDRRATWAYLGFDLIEDRWDPGRNLDLMHRPEDVFLGRRFWGSAGYSPDTLGADDRRVLFNLNARDAAQLDERALLIGYAETRGALRGDDPENLFVSAGARYHRAHTEQFRFFAEINARYVAGLTRDQQLLLGGDSGLRGYPQRFQSGDRRVMVRLEERFFPDLHFYRLLRFGGAVFVDAGRAWFPGQADEDDETGWLANVGAGLRVSSSRAPTNSMLHIDFAVPLVTGGPDVDDFLIAVTMKETL